MTKLESRARYWFASGPTEICDTPAIYRDDPAGGDPRVVVVAKTVFRPEAIQELCGLANEALEAREASRVEAA